MILCCLKRRTSCSESENAPEPDIGGRPQHAMCSHFHGSDLQVWAYMSLEAIMMQLSKDAPGIGIASRSRHAITKPAL